MRGYAWLLGLLLIVSLLVLPCSLSACPLCKEGVSAPGPEEDDSLREARAWNNSIYLMVGMPYLLLGAFGYMVYRGLKQKALADQMMSARLARAQASEGATPPLP
jgi:hypothetical protein